MPKTTISQQQMQQILGEIKGARFATIVMETELSMNKRNNPYYGRVTKRTSVNVTLNASYRNGVVKSLKKAGYSKAVANSVQVDKTWGEKVCNTCFKTHNNETYLTAKPNARPQVVTYLLDGQIMGDGDTAQALSFVPAKKATPVPTFSVNVNNVKEVKVNKEHYLIK